MTFLALPIRLSLAPSACTMPLKLRLVSLQYRHELVQRRHCRIRTSVALGLCRVMLGIALRALGSAVCISKSE